MPPKKSIRTMQDILDTLPELGFSDATVAQIRPQIKRCSTIYNAPLNRIPADLKAFEKKWGRGRGAGPFHQLGFTSQQQFKAWRKRVSNALSRATMEKPRTAISDEWAELIRVAAENGGVGRFLPPHLDQSIRAIAKPASNDGITPCNVDGAWIEEAAKPLKGNARKQFKRGINAVNKLIEARDNLGTEAAQLLPERALAQPAPVKRAASNWRRDQGPHTERLWRDFDRLVAQKRGYDTLGRPVPAEFSGFNAITERNYARDLRIAAATLEQCDQINLDSRPGIADICTPENIRVVVNTWKQRSRDGEVSEQAGTRQRLASHLENLARQNGHLTNDDEAKLTDIVKHVYKNGPPANQMSRKRWYWIKSFAADPAQERRVLMMPDLLMKESRSHLQNWEQYKKERKRKLMIHALYCGIAAAQAEILFRVTPVRARNLRTLSIRGPDATLVHVDTESPRIDIPGRTVKNKYDIDALFESDAGPVLRFYLDEIRPRLVSDHPYGKNHDDGDFLFPGTLPGCPLNETTFAEYYRHGCDHIGEDMTLHLARHICAFMILRENPNAIAEAAALLGISIRTTRQFYAFMDEMRLQEEGREMLRRSRKEALKHRKGTRDG